LAQVLRGLNIEPQIYRVDRGCSSVMTARCRRFADGMDVDPRNLSSVRRLRYGILRVAWARHWTEASRFEVRMSLSLRFERQRDCYVLPFLFVGHRDSNWYYAAVGWLWWRVLVET